MLPSLPRHQLAAIHIRAIALTAGWIKATWRTVHKMPDGSLQGLSPVDDLSLSTGDFRHSSAFYRAGLRSFHEVLNNAAPQ